MQVVHELANILIGTMHFEWLNCTRYFWENSAKTVLMSCLFVHVFMSLSRFPTVEIGTSDVARIFISRCSILKIQKTFAYAWSY